MDLLQNPFHILGATPRDNSRRILELADERSLLLDSSECMKARSDLTNPRKRISAELAWLPGIGPKRTREVMSLLESPIVGFDGMEKLTSIARANLLAAGLTRLNRYSTEIVVKWILELAWEFEKIDSEDICTVINEERIVSGLPEVTDLSAVEAEITERRRHYRQVIKSVLDNLPAVELVKAVTTVVELATDVGEEHGPILVYDLVDSYEVEAQSFLEKEERNISVLVESLRAAADSQQKDPVLSTKVNRLIHVVKNWDTIAQPIQVSTKSLGKDHEASRRVAGLVRDVAVDLYNKHGKLDFSQQLTKTLKEVFAEVAEVAERSIEDEKALGEIAKQRLQSIEDEKKQANEWGREITYEGYVGVVFKEKLRISPAGIEWKGKVWNLDSITRVRWGTTTISTRSRYSSVSLPSKVIEKIQFGNNSGLATVTIETSFSLAAAAVKSVIGKAENPIVFDRFTDCLWKAVCVRIFKSYINGFRDGKKYRFGTTLVSDSGVEIVKRSFFSGGDSVFCRWREIEAFNENGQFCIRKKDNQKFESSLSFQDEDNIHILAAMINMLKKNGNERLSDILG